MLPAVGAALLVLAGCTADAGRPAEPTWVRAAPLPTVGVLHAVDGDRLVVAGDLAGQRPAMLLQGSDGSSARVRLRPATYYGRLTLWRGLATSGDRVYAFGGARGGAHGNMRWTVWSGSLEHGLREDEQTFETFGGWGAGGLVGIGLLHGRPVLVGSWRSDGPGLDVALWHLRGRTWCRAPSTGTALAGTPRAQVSARGVDPAGDGLVISGAVTVLRDHTVRTRPAVWVSRSGASAWSRVLLPSARDSVVGEAHAASWSLRVCTVVGRVDGRLAVWDLDARTGAAHPADVPEVDLVRGVVLPAPVLAGDGLVLVAPAERRASVLVRHDDGWEELAGPPGTAVDAAAVGSRLQVVTTDRQGRSSLWSGDLRRGR